MSHNTASGDHMRLHRACAHQFLKLECECFPHNSPYSTLVNNGWGSVISGGHVIPRCSVMTHRIPIKLQLPGKSRLIFNSISSSLHPGSHEILKPTFTES